MSILEKDFIVTRPDFLYNKYLELTLEEIGSVKVSLCAEKESTNLFIPLFEPRSEVDIVLGFTLNYRNYNSYVDSQFGSGVRLNYYSNITKDGDVYRITDSGGISDFYT